MTGEQEELFLKHCVLFACYRMRSLGLGTEMSSLVIPVVSTHPTCSPIPASLLDCPCGNACTGFDINDPCGSLPTLDSLFFYYLFATFSVFRGLTSITQCGLSKVE